MRPRILSLLIPALLTACSTFGSRERDEQTLERFLDHAGPPVRDFSYLGGINGWTSLDREHVVVYTGVNDAYLLTVAPPCNDLNFANRIGLTSTGSTVSARFDSVIVDGLRCQILQIRPVDYGAVRQAAKEEREAVG
jgi:Family of unknown function (DUF6491)